MIIVQSFPRVNFPIGFPFHIDSNQESSVANVVPFQYDMMFIST